MKCIVRHQGIAKTTVTVHDDPLIFTFRMDGIYSRKKAIQRVFQKCIKDKDGWPDHFLRQLKRLTKN